MLQETGSPAPAAGRQAVAWKQRRRSIARRCRIVLLFTAAVMAGCSDKPAGISFGEVSGTVTLDGQPLPDATVRFEPAAGRPSFGRTGADGHYELGYRGRSWGAVVGPHTVRITTEDRIENEATGETRVVRELLPARYHARSELTAEVAAGENMIDFSLEGNPRDRR